MTDKITEFVRYCNDYKLHISTITEIDGGTKIICCAQYPLEQDIIVQDLSKHAVFGNMFDSGEAIYKMSMGHYVYANQEFGMLERYYKPENGTGSCRIMDKWHTEQVLEKLNYLFCIKTENMKELTINAFRKDLQELLDRARKEIWKDKISFSREIANKTDALADVGCYWMYEHDFAENLIEPAKHTEVYEKAVNLNKQLISKGLIKRTLK